MDTIFFFEGNYIGVLKEITMRSSVYNGTNFFPFALMKNKLFVFSQSHKILFHEIINKIYLLNGKKKIEIM